jgi:N-succinyldiaminopimelate aminotransferase
MNPRLQSLQPYPFERLRALLDGAEYAGALRHIPLSVGEPRHAAPDCARRALLDALDGLSQYPATRGSDALREVIARWLVRRFALPQVDPGSQVLPVNGTREALFAFAQAVVDPGPGALVMLPNPFYQIYEGAALLAGAQPRFLNCTPETDFLPDIDSVSADEWRRCQLLYLCNPGNPSGAVMPLAQLQRLVQLADEYDFVIAGDECYSEIYPDEDSPPPGLLQACATLGDSTYRRCVVFHSLSKRSSLPGLRSGFVAGDAGVLADFLRYRTYHGCAMPPHHQAASIAAWSDEAHVLANRALYRDKFDAVLGILGEAFSLRRPAAGFYLWPETPLDDTGFARELFRQQNVTVLPGSFLARESGGANPGAGRVRLALVAELADCIEAAGRIRDALDARGRATC